MKLPLKHMALSLAVICAASVVSISPALAHDTPKSYKMAALEKNIEIAGLDVPEAVMAQIEDIYAALDETKAAFAKDKKEAVLNAVDSSNQGQLNSLDDYYESDRYQSLYDQENALKTQGRSLLKPYIQTPKAERRQRLSIPDGLSAAQRVDYASAHYQDEFEGYGFPLSRADVQSLEGVLRDKLPARAQLIALSRSGENPANSPDYERLKEELRELSSRESALLRPYYKKYHAKNSAQRSLSRAFRPAINYAVD